MNISEAISLAKHKNKIGYQWLYHQYAKEMYAVSFRITNHKEETKDILQESFLKAFKSLDQLKDEQKFKSWLKRIVVNKSLVSIKHKYKILELNHIDVTEQIEDHWYHDISIKQIRNAIQELPDGCRSIFSLYAIESLKHKEIAEELNISVSTSKSQYQYACKLLRAKLTKIKTYEH